MNPILLEGSCFRYLREMDTACVDGVVTDPPYSSGGLFRGDRAASTNTKYLNSENISSYIGFSGDNKDQRSFMYWSVLWLEEAMRVTKPGGIIAMFSDWRQYPAAADMMQMAGWVWRGAIPWDKTEGSRPQKGRPRAQCEYILWGTNGNFKAFTEDCLPGFIRCMTLSSQNGKKHIAEKPLPVILELLKMYPPGAKILDPFMGSGVTAEACFLTGREFVGFDIDPHWVEVTRDRIATAEMKLKLQPTFFGMMEDVG